MMMNGYASKSGQRKCGEREGAERWRIFALEEAVLDKDNDNNSARFNGTQFLGFQRDNKTRFQEPLFSVTFNF